MLRLLTSVSGHEHISSIAKALAGSASLSAVAPADYACTHCAPPTIASELAELGLPVQVRELVLNYSPMSRGITDAVTNRYA